MCLRAASPNVGDNSRDAFYGFGGVLFIMSSVISSDHDDGDFGVSLTTEVTAVDAVKYVFGAVTREAEIEGFTVTIVFFPGRFSFSFPALSNGVADKDEVILVVCGEFVFGFMAVFPPFLFEAVGGENCGVGAILGTSLHELFFHGCKGVSVFGFVVYGGHFLRIFGEIEEIVFVGVGEEHEFVMVAANAIVSSDGVYAFAIVTIVN